MGGSIHLFRLSIQSPEKGLFRLENRVSGPIPGDVNQMAGQFRHINTGESAARETAQTQETRR